MQFVSEESPFAFCVASVQQKRFLTHHHQVPMFLGKAFLTAWESLCGELEYHFSDTGRNAFEKLLPDAFGRRSPRIPLRIPEAPFSCAASEKL
jgi:hypothetical protein